MGAVRIVTDSACDLANDEAEAGGITIVPLSIRFGDREYVDRTELTVADFYARMAESDTLPETAAPAPGAFESVFRQLSAEGAEAIVCINLSLALSATGQAAQNAARAVAPDIDARVIDSRSITVGLGSIVLEAAAAAEGGATADEIAALVDDMSERTHVFGVLDTLENLKKGGRVGGARALVGSVLSIKPLLDLSSGATEEAGRARTRKRALAWLRDKLAEFEGATHVAVGGGDAPDLDDFVAMLRPVVGDEDIRVADIGAVIGTHAGPGVVGMSFVRPTA